MRQHTHHDRPANPDLRHQPVDNQMAYYKADGDDQAAGEEYIVRLIAEFNGQTWVYTYPPGEAAGMVDVLAEQAMNGKVPMMLANTLMDMVVEGMDAGI